MGVLPALRRVAVGVHGGDDEQQDGGAERRDAEVQHEANAQREVTDHFYDAHFPQNASVLNLLRDQVSQPCRVLFLCTLTLTQTTPS